MLLDADELESRRPLAGRRTQDAAHHWTARALR